MLEYAEYRELIFLKNFLWVFNCLQMVAGVVMTYRGTKSIATLEPLDYFLVPIHDYLLPAKLLNIFGVLNIVLSFFGCYAAFKEGTCTCKLLIAYIVSVFIVMILELPVVILAYGIYYGNDNNIAQIMAYSMTNYDSNPAAQVALDHMHSTLSCCGLKYADDWDSILHYKRVYRFCGGAYGAAYENGCLHGLTTVVKKEAFELGVTPLMLVPIRIHAMFFAYFLLYVIKRQKTDRERRQSDIRQSPVDGYQPLGINDLQPTVDNDD